MSRRKKTPDKPCHFTGCDAMRPWFRLAIIGILLSLVGGGCADTGASSGNDKRGIFYGGVSGGGTWP